MLRLQNLKGSDAGIYRCSATNFLGNAHEDTQLIVHGNLVYMLVSIINELKLYLF